MKDNLNPFSGKESVKNEKLNLDYNKHLFYKNMKNSCKVDMINYLNVLSIEDFNDVIRSIFTSAELPFDIIMLNDNK